MRLAVTPPVTNRLRMEAGINEVVMELGFCWKGSEVENENETFSYSLAHVFRDGMKARYQANERLPLQFTKRVRQGQITDFLTFQGGRKL